MAAQSMAVMAALAPLGHIGTHPAYTPDGSHQAAGAHAGGHAAGGIVHLKLEHTSGQRPVMAEVRDGRQPNRGFSRCPIWSMEVPRPGSPDRPQRFFPEGHHRKPNHVSTATGHRRPSRPGR